MSTSDTKAIRDAIAVFLKQRADVAEDELNDDTNILDLIDSFTYLEMTQHLEAELAIEIDFVDADPEDMAYLGKLVQYCSRS